MNLESRPYGYYADMISKFDPADTIIKFGDPQEKVVADVPTNKNVIVMYSNYGYHDGLSLLFKRTGNDLSDLMRLEYTVPSTKTNADNNLKFIETSIKNFESIVRNGKPNDYVIIFCSDNPSDQINDPRVTYDPKTKTYEFDNLSKSYDDKKYGGLNKDILMDKYVPTAPGVIHGPRLILIFKKSDPTTPPVVQPPQYVVVNKKPNDKKKTIDDKPITSVIKYIPNEHALTSIEIFLIICVSFIVIAHIVEIIILLRTGSRF